jgi:hypothetical protein
MHRSLCAATTSTGTSCGGILEAMNAGMKCDDIDPATNATVYDTSSSSCNALTSVQAASVVASSKEPYIGKTCTGIIRSVYVPAPSALDARLAPLLPPYVVQSIIEQKLAANIAKVPLFFSSACLLAQRQYACSIGFNVAHKVTALGAAFNDFYLPSFPHQDICTYYLRTCSGPIKMVPSLNGNCSAVLSNGLKQFPTGMQSIVSINLGAGPMVMQTPPNRQAVQNVTASYVTQCPYATAVLDKPILPCTFMVQRKCHYLYVYIYANNY